MANEENPISIRLGDDLDQRFRSAAEKVKLPKNALARQAIEAATEAVEQYDGEIVAPIKFSVKKIPSANIKS